MRHMLILLVIMLVATACGPHMYNTISAGKENSSFIIVLTSGKSYGQLTLVVDGKTFPIEKVYKVKAMAKAHPVIISPGKHIISVESKGIKLVEENIFIGLQETKKIILE